MESLLASIRKAIDSDIGKNTKPALPAAQDTPFKGAMRELRVKYDDEPPVRRDASGEISELRNKIQKNRRAGYAFPLVRPATQASPLPPPKPRRNRACWNIGWGQQVPLGAANPMSPAPTFARPDRPPASSHETRRAESIREWAGRTMTICAAPLMSAKLSTRQLSFNQLADTLMARALGERSIEDMTQDLLKGMLRSWLDAHLPALVEKLVREEIERVARRGR
jgi:cell pole-organizing protein PopZ